MVLPPHRSSRHCARMATSCRTARFHFVTRRKAMVGRNFWAVADGAEWVVYEEGLPDQTTRHAGRDEAWAVANRRAAALKGEAFLQDADGALVDRIWHGDL